ncbi:MAG: ATP-binding protein [Acidobacteriota bacterium]|nr:ATP-binding protein [Acidobacteriota bacterium]MDH3523206.1 ATP-binding protein [Acidobacteriota bacterium]
MSEPRPAVTHPLGVEWSRVELLASLLSQARRGREAPENRLEELRRLQAQVEAGRANGAWRAIAVPLAALEYDVLACAAAPEAEPRLAWVFQNLQPGVAQPYPTAALLHELLALDSESSHLLYAALAEGGTLRRADLIQLESDDPFQPIRPASGVTARLLGRPPLETAPPGATRVTLSPSWEDLILPASRTAMLQEFLLWIRHRSRVFGEWGGVDCGGPVALFSGPSGTGKTFAAAVLATELGWPLYRVDLGRLVSKYIGETEKNLNRLFDAAHGRPMVLQFDEADSLFSKRGEVKEARDRYANMEVSHLLARIESHQGPCILTTNLRRNLDPAFARRFQVVADFPRPAAAARALLWERLLPPAAPRASDVDTAFLGEAVNLTGGEIRNAALHAAFLAAESGRPIGLPEITLAVWRELSKSGRDLSPADLGPLAPWFPEEGLLC